mmetsp:Transcript_11434/g.39768  ORF Transcript_11434/g.39768 Transcript_11434/m.39768 type:complete len:485 (-) Transcript_11434:105-1559(-)
MSAAHRQGAMRPPGARSRPVRTRLASARASPSGRVEDLVPPQGSGSPHSRRNAGLGTAAGVAAAAVWCYSAWHAPAATAAAAAALLWDSASNTSVPELRAGGSEFNEQVLARCVALRQPYRPFPGLRNRHLSTVSAALLRTPPELNYRRDHLRMADGGYVTLDWPAATRGLPADAPILLALPGIAGGSGDAYVKALLGRAVGQGYRGVAMNSRGCGGGPITTPQFYSASYTGDLKAVTAELRRRHPSAPIFAVGWSLGASILVNYLGEAGDDTPVNAACAMCAPWRLDKADETFEEGVMGKVYSRNMGSSMHELVAPHAHMFARDERYDVDAILRCRTVREFDEQVTRRTFGWDSVEEYYHHSSPVHALPDVAVPLLAVSAADDPIAPSEWIPVDHFATAKRSALVVTPSGGHLGWVNAEAGPVGAPWTDEGVMEWFQAVELALAQRGELKAGGGGEDEPSAVPDTSEPAVPAVTPAAKAAMRR